MKRTACNGFCACRGFIGLAVWLAWCVAPPASLSAQDSSRAEVIARAQTAKAEHLGVEGPSWLEKLAVRVIAFDTSSLYPLAEGVYPGAGTAFGAGYRRRLPRHTHLTLGAGVALTGSMFAEAGARIPEIAGGRFAVALNGRHTVAQNLPFYGLGPNSARDSSLQYDYRTTTLTATVAFHPVRWVELSGTYEWLTLRSDLEAPNPAGAALGFGEGLSYNVVTASATLDWRPSPSYSTRGGSHRLTWSQYLPTQDRPFQFHQLEYEGIQLVPILHEQWVLALRVLTTLTTAEAGSAVPAVLSPTLGGAETLRGYETRRFTDRNRLLVTGEYRWRPSRWIDLALFCDAGRVGARRQDLGLSNMETDWGVGLRGHGPRSAAFRIEGARGRGGWEAVFVVGSPQ